MPRTPTPSPDARIIATRRETLYEVKRDLRCQLTEEEVNDRGQELARMHGRYGRMLSEHKAAKAKMRDDEKDLEMLISGKAYDVRSKTEERVVECEWQADYDRQLAVLVRTDTGEEIKTRELTEDDRQRSML